MDLTHPQATSKNITLNVFSLSHTYLSLTERNIIMDRTFPRYKIVTLFWHYKRCMITNSDKPV